MGGKTVDQSYPKYLIKKGKRRTPEEEDRWWAFVALFCRVFAESAQGECFLISRVPYKKVCRSIWASAEYPALLLNPKVTKVTCIDVYNNSKRQVLLDRGGGGKAPSTRASIIALIAIASNTCDTCGGKDHGPRTCKKASGSRGSRTAIK